MRSRARSSDGTALPRSGTEAAICIRARNRSSWPTPSLIPKVAQRPRMVLSTRTRASTRCLRAVMIEHTPYATGELADTSL